MTPTEQIDKQIENLNDWRGAVIDRVRKLIHDAHHEIIEDWKWNTAVFTHSGNVCALGAFKDHVKINFFKGASLPDPNKLFNAGLDAKATRAIDISEGDKLNEKALKTLIREAVAANKKK